VCARVKFTAEALTLENPGTRNRIQSPDDPFRPAKDDLLTGRANIATRGAEIDNISDDNTDANGPRQSVLLQNRTSTFHSGEYTFL